MEGWLWPMVENALEADAGCPTERCCPVNGWRWLWRIHVMCNCIELGG